VRHHAAATLRAISNSRAGIGAGSRHVKATGRSPRAAWHQGDRPSRVAYRRTDDTDEIVAELYALLMTRRAAVRSEDPPGSSARSTTS